MVEVIIPAFSECVFIACYEPGTVPGAGCDKTHCPHGNCSLHPEGEGAFELERSFYCTAPRATIHITVCVSATPWVVKCPNYSLTG